MLFYVYMRLTNTDYCDVPSIRKIIVHICKHAHGVYYQYDSISYNVWVQYVCVSWQQNKK